MTEVEGKKIEAFDVLQKLSNLEIKMRDLKQQYQTLVSEIKDNDNNKK